MKSFADFRIEIPPGRSGEVSTTCPECSHSRKKKTARCLSVNTDDGVWHCHHCGWNGTLKAGGHAAPVTHWQKPAYRKPAPVPADPAGLADPVVSWFAVRGIPAAVLERNRIGSGLIYMPQVEDHVRAISFPYYRRADLINVKYRDNSKNFRLEAGAERILYGLNDMAETTLIVEGEVDKLSLEVAGFPNCVSVPDGAPAPTAKNYSSKFDYLSADDLAGVSTWILAVDADDPGRRLEDELARRLGRERCRRVRWPAGCKDANQVLTEHGAAILAECIEHAEPYPLKGVFEVRDFTDRVDHLYANGWERGLSTGWHALDEYYTVRPSELSVITGMPGSGKSNLLDCLAVNMARAHGWHIAVFSPENQPIEDHIARLAEKWIGAPFGNGPTPRMTRAELDQALEDLQAHFHFILDEDDSEWTLDAILANTAALVLRHGVRGLIIDPWNELEHQRPQGVTETEHISSALKRIRQFARQKGVHIWVVAHPAKLYRDKGGEYPVPSLYEISGSAHWRNKSDNGLSVWRDFSADNPDAVEVHVQKIRFRQVGRVGMAELRFDRRTHTYRDPDFKSIGREYNQMSEGK